MKTLLVTLSIVAVFFSSRQTGFSAASNELASALQQGLFEEEANNNLDAAIQAYERVANQFDRDRKLAATAVFRLGECYRKQGRTNEAAACYSRIISQFADAGTLATLSGQNLAGMGMEPKPTQLAPAAPSTAASTSAEEEEIKRIRALIQNSPDLINAYVNGFTPLHKAASAGQLVVARFLLENGAAVNAHARSQGDTRTPIQMAAKAGHRSVVQLLIQHKADVNVTDASGETALHKACGEGFMGVAEVLLAAGANPKAADGSGGTPLHLAAGSGHAAIAEMLIKHGADARATRRNGTTPLHAAAQQGHTVMAKLLLKNGADVNARGENKATPLGVAVNSGHHEAVKLLLAANANPNLFFEMVSDSARRVEYPIHTAVESRSHEIAKLLLDHDADPNAILVQPQSDATPLLLAIWQRDHGMAALLLEKGADPSLCVPVEGEAWETPLIAAVKTGLELTVRALLDHKADVNGADVSGCTPLHYCLGQPAILKIISAAKPRANSVNDQGQTPLHWAISSGLIDASSELIRLGANVNAQDKFGLSPLHYATMRKNKAAMSLLLEANADPNIRNNVGATPLDMEKGAYFGFSLMEQRPATGVTTWRINESGFGGMALPAPPPSRSLRLPGAVSANPPKSEYADLLRKHGAMDVLPEMEAIKFGRSDKEASRVISKKGTNDWNRFTLLELIGMVGGFLSTDPTTFGGSAYTQPAFAHSFPALQFPDLANVQIRRPSRAGAVRWEVIKVDAAKILAEGDCSKEATLEWGDVVVLPEADHALNETWKGFDLETLQAFNKCWEREVHVIVKGKRTALTLGASIKQPLPVSGTSRVGSTPHPPVSPPPPTIYASTPMWLKPVLLNSGLLLSSSDLSRIKVIRKDESGSKKELVIDCSGEGPALWLRDGDVIEVPEKAP